MFEVYKSPDPFERFIEICDECIEEINIEAQRKLYKEKDFNCLYCLYHEKTIRVYVSRLSLDTG